MNSLSDILSGRMEDIFPAPTQTSTSTPTNVPLSPLPESLSNPTSFQTAPISAEPKPEEAKTPETKEQSLDIAKLKAGLRSMRDQIDSMLRLLDGNAEIKIVPPTVSDTLSAVTNPNDRIVEGVFNGEKMVGPDGREYSVPPNYASKSKLVEGDIMKLTITNSGSFIYKQIQPTPRKRIVGELHRDDAGQWNVVVEGKPYRVLTASVTFYKGQQGDEVVILVPEDGGATWGAVDNLIHKGRY